MTKLRRIVYFLTGILTILGSIILFSFGSNGMVFIMLIVSIFLIGFGVKKLHYYSSMARHMVGGKRTLYLGLISFDFGLFTLSLSDDHPIYPIIYLTAFFIVTGAIDFLKAFEEKKYKAPGWQFRLVISEFTILLGIGTIIIGLIYKESDLIITLFSIIMAYSGVNRIIKAFRKSDVVYIQ